MSSKSTASTLADSKPILEDVSRKPRGFAGLDRDKLREIASMGGKAAHARGTAHEFTSEEARIAGHKGGKVTHERRRLAKAAEGEGTVLVNDLQPGSTPDIDE